MTKINLSVSVDDAHLNQFSEVVKRCKDAGMEVREQMVTIGVISGSIDSSKIPALNNVEGVAHVEQSRDFQVAPPDNPVQ